MASIYQKISELLTLYSEALFIIGQYIEVRKFEDAQLNEKLDKIKELTDWYGEREKIAKTRTKRPNGFLLSDLQCSYLELILFGNRDGKGNLELKRIIKKQTEATSVLIRCLLERRKIENAKKEKK